MHSSLPLLRLLLIVSIFSLEMEAFFWNKEPSLSCGKLANGSGLLWMSQLTNGDLQLMSRRLEYFTVDGKYFSASKMSLEAPDASKQLDSLSLSLDHSKSRLLIQNYLITPKTGACLLKSGLGRAGEKSVYYYVLLDRVDRSKMVFYTFGGGVYDTEESAVSKRLEATVVKGTKKAKVPDGTLISCPKMGDDRVCLLTPKGKLAVLKLEVTQGELVTVSLEPLPGSKTGLPSLKTPLSSVDGGFLYSPAPNAPAMVFLFSNTEQSVSLYLAAAGGRKGATAASEIPYAQFFSCSGGGGPSSGLLPDIFADNVGAILVPVLGLAVALAVVGCICLVAKGDSLVGRSLEAGISGKRRSPRKSQERAMSSSSASGQSDTSMAGESENYRA